jgi:hypothetical protein
MAMLWSNTSYSAGRRHLGAYLQSRARSREERRRAEKHRAPAAVMAETAVLDFLAE